MNLRGFYGLGRHGTDDGAALHTWGRHESLRAGAALFGFITELTARAVDTVLLSAQRVLTRAMNAGVPGAAALAGVRVRDRALAAQRIQDRPLDAAVTREL